MAADQGSAAKTPESSSSPRPDARRDLGLNPAAEQLPGGARLPKEEGF
jgi:hypothetical protein